MYTLYMKGDCHFDIRFLTKYQNKSKKYNNTIVHPLRFPLIFEKLKEEDRGYESLCWIWKGSKNKGYGQTGFAGKIRRVHIIVYCYLLGDFDFTKLEIDHLCRQRDCANPEHLEPVPQITNMLRGNLPSIQERRNKEIANLYYELLKIYNLV